MGHKVEPCSIYCIDDNGHADRFLRRTRGDGHANGGGDACCRGGVDGRLDKVIALISPKYGLAGDGGGGF